MTNRMCTSEMTPSSSLTRNDRSVEGLGDVHKDGHHSSIRICFNNDALRVRLNLFTLAEFLMLDQVHSILKVLKCELYFPNVVMWNVMRL